MMHVKELSRVSSSLSLVVIDMDGLKKINDTFGHSVGNEALKVFARQLKEIVRLSDIACRFGGDEFGVILPYTDERAASYFIERLSTLLSGKSMRVSVGHEKTKMEIPIRMSAGSGTIKGILKWKNLRDVETTVNAMLHAADKNMYFNKRANKMARKEANEQNTKAAIDKET
jgi:diguanylate cyclase (GGDEF)-like protein